MADDFRTCRRAGCRWPAAASLSYHYPTRQVWLLDLVDAADPSVWDLCPGHATALTVPRGWERVDQRTARSEEGAGRGLLHDHPAPRALTGPAAPRAPQAPATGAPSRYAALRAELPRLAAQWAAAGHGAPGAGGVEQQAAREDGSPADLDETAPRPVRHRSRPFPGRELTPMVQDTGPGQGSPGVEKHVAEIPGQLAIPVPGNGSGVVVHLDLGVRRRGE